MEPTMVRGKIRLSRKASHFSGMTVDAEYRPSREGSLLCQSPSSLSLSMSGAPESPRHRWGSMNTMKRISAKVRMIGLLGKHSTRRGSHAPLLSLKDERERNALAAAFHAHHDLISTPDGIHRLLAKCSLPVSPGELATLLEDIGYTRILTEDMFVDLVMRLACKSGSVAPPTAAQAEETEMGRAFENLSGNDEPPDLSDRIPLQVVRDLMNQFELDNSVLPASTPLATPTTGSAPNPTITFEKLLGMAGMTVSPKPKGNHHVTLPSIDVAVHDSGPADGMTKARSFASPHTQSFASKRSMHHSPHSRASTASDDALGGSLYGDECRSFSVCSPLRKKSHDSRASTASLSIESWHPEASWRPTESQMEQSSRNAPRTTDQQSPVKSPSPSKHERPWRSVQRALSPDEQMYLREKRALLNAGRMSTEMLCELLPQMDVTGMTTFQDQEQLRACVSPPLCSSSLHKPRPTPPTAEEVLAKVSPQMRRWTQSSSLHQGAGMYGTNAPTPSPQRAAKKKVVSPKKA